MIFQSFAAVAILLIACATSHAQRSTTSSHSAGSGASSSESAIGQGRILLVLPFDNITTPNSPAAPTSLGNSRNLQGDSQSASSGNIETSSLDWLREAAPEILNSRLTSAGFFPLTREDRLYALDHLGLPETFQPSRATAIRIAQTLDANYVLVGSYRVSGTTLSLEARIVDVAKLRISDTITQAGEISKLIPLLNSLAWQIARKLDPSFSVSEETFRTADANIHLDAFEQYIRGLTEHDDSTRLRHLKKATDLNPNFLEAWRAQGKLDFANQQYEESAVAFGKVAALDPSDLESAFYRGLSLIFSGNYPRASEAFAAVARVLPLPEVVNNEAVAESRRGHDAVALFRQAEVADPNDADYHFNLAVSLHRKGSQAEALTELAQSLKLHPTDSEARALQTAWKSTPEKSSTPPAPNGANLSAGVPGSTASNAPQSIEPLERIKRTYDGAAFRQASQMLDQVEQARLAALPGPQRAQKLATSAREKLNRGLLLEAERGFQSALAADPNNSEAKSGLAQVRERAGTIDTAHP